MANPFDQFDDVKSKANPFDRFDVPELMPSHSPELMASHERYTPKDSEFERVTKGTIRALAPITRPALEGGGMVAGGAAGALGGIETGPGAVLTGIAGGATGYAAGKGIQDILDIYAGTKKPYQGAEAFTETAKDIGTGVLLEGGGRVATKVVLVPAFKGGKWVFNKVVGGLRSLFSKKGVEMAANEILQASTSQGTIYAKNAEEAAKIEKEIPGLKFTLGQRTNDPALLKLERTQLKATGGAAAQNAEQIASNDAALKDYYEKNFPGNENIDDLMGDLSGKKAVLQKGAETAAQTVEKTAAELSKAEPPETGQKIVEALKEGKKTAKQAAGELYNKVPEAQIPIKNMLKEFDEIAKPMNEFEDPSNIPPILSQVKEIIGEQETISLKSLQGLRHELGKNLRQAQKLAQNGSIGEQLPSRLSKALDAVDNAISEAETSVKGAAAERLKTANKFFRKEYIEKFKQGTSGEILRKGPRGETTRISLAQIPNKIWNFRNISAADDFINAVGKEKASNIMRDHAAYDLMQNATDPSGKVVTSKLNTWLKRNAGLLDKFGISKDFEGFVNAQVAADAANQASAAFEKSVASKILNADPEKAIGNAIKGSNTARAAQDLLNLVKGNKAAENGLKKSFADYIINSVQTTAKDVAGNPTISNAALNKAMKKYMPAIKVLYKNEPAKIKALMTIQKAYEIMIRNAKSPIGGGPETAETLLTQIGKLHHFSKTSSRLMAIIKAFKKAGDKEVNEIVTRGVLDPDYAVELSNLYKKEIPDSEINQIINGKIINLEQYRNKTLGRVAAGVAAAGTRRESY